MSGEVNYVKELEQKTFAFLLRAYIPTLEYPQAAAPFYYTIWNQELPGFAEVI